MSSLNDKLDYEYQGGKVRWCEVCENPMVKVGFAWLCHICGRRIIFASQTWRRTYEAGS